MKIVHIATMDSGGAALGMLNLHRTLVSKGIDSEILVLHKSSADPLIQQMQPNYQLFDWSHNKLIQKGQKILRRRGKCRTIVEQWNEMVAKASNGHEAVCFTSPFSNYDITQHPSVIDADIIHLHWVGGFLDYPSFFQKIDKPIVWTLRDENPGLGGFHYKTDKINFCNYYEKIEDSFLQIKRQSLKDKDITLVALSDVMIYFCKNVDFLKNKHVVKIYNPIDGAAFHPIDRKLAKKALGIEEDVLTISFVSFFLSDYRKGLTDLMQALSYLNRKVKVLCVGENDFFTQHRDDVICFGSIKNTNLMSLIYSASDIFVNPTRQESFGKTTVEALLCGVPVISTAEGVAPEIIDYTCGQIIQNTDPEVIAKAINIVSGKKYDRDSIRQKSMKKFDPQLIADEHIRLYKECLMKGTSKEDTSLLP